MTIFGHDPNVLLTVNRMGWGSQIPHEINLAFADFAASCSNPVLDLGAGFGAATVAALKRGANVVANDLDNAHLEILEASVPTELRDRLKVVLGRFPSELSFPDSSLGAIHASNVLHFLSLTDIEVGLDLMHKWLVPNGKVFVMSSSPYAQNFKSFIPVFEQRKNAGIRWPGWIEDLTLYSSHPTLQHLPSSLNVFDADVLSTAFKSHGFFVEIAREYSRTAIPENLRYDGRENVMVVARK
jgi:SAM-dependent methyltransferase